MLTLPCITDTIEIKKYIVEYGMSKILSTIISFFIGTSMSINIWNSPIVKNEPIHRNTFRIEETIVLDDPEVGMTTTKPITNIPSSSGWWTYPNDIKLTQKSGDDLLVLVNKEYRLSENYAPKDLVSASNAGIRKGENFKLRSIIIDDLRELVNSAKNDGIDLSIRSGYRSYQDQLYTYNYWLRVNGNNPDEADKISARAGHSQHQLGTVVDFSSSEIQDGIGGQFHTTKASKWLSENAWRFGFVIGFPKGYESTTGYSYESWHYRYIGKNNVKEMMNRGEILEIYLRGKN